MVAFYQRALILVFLLGLFAPIAVTVRDILDGPDSAHQEFRAETPALPDSPAGVLRFARQFKWYFEQRFGLREWLIGLHGRFKVELLGVSSNERVVLGKDPWLYTTNEGTLEDHRGLDPLTARELQHLAAELTRRRDRLAAHGIDYVVAIAPDKQTLYPEHLPERFRRITTVTRLDQALAYLGEHTDVDVVDFRPVLARARPSVRVFHRSDTHWNEVGAYLAAGVLIGRLRARFPALPEPPDAIPPVRREVAHGGDLSRQLALQSRWQEELLTPALPRPPLLHDGESFIPLPSHDVLGPERVVLESAGGTPGTVVILRDSFGVALMPWLSPYFERSVYLASYGLPWDEVIAEAPTLVIQQLVERKLLKLVEAADPGLSDLTLFVGDSLTAFGDFTGVAGPHRNHGRNGDVAGGVRERVARLSVQQPKRIVLMIGTNDLARGHAPARIADTVADIVGLVRRTSPETGILIQSVLPVRLPQSPGRNAEIRELNAALTELAERERVAFLDLHGAFLDGTGELAEGLTRDGVHLTDAGYALWRARLAAWFASQAKAGS